MRHAEAKIYAVATINHNDEPRRILLNLYRDEDGAYRWYEAETGVDTEVSGATIEEAQRHAEGAWSGPWDIQLGSETTQRHYELTYDLPGASGGHRADPRWYVYPVTDTDEDGYLTNDARAFLHTAQRELDDYVTVLVAGGATHIRLNSATYRFTRR